MSDDAKEVKLDTRRQFIYEPKNSKEVFTYYLVHPGGKDARKAEWEYAKVYTQAMADGIPTSSQMMDNLRNIGVISPEFERELEKTNIALTTALYRLDITEDQEELEDTALEVARLRGLLFKLNQKVNGPLGATCEGLADNARAEYLTSRVVVKEDGSKVWETYEDFLDDDDSELVATARMQFLMWNSGLESDFMEQMPENKVLARIAEERVKEVMDAAQAELDKHKAAQEEVVEELSLPEVEEEKDPPKKKPGRPRGSTKAKAKTTTTKKVARKPKA